MNMNASVQTVMVPTTYRQNAGEVSAEPLTEKQKEETLEFLARRPLHAVIMSGWIRENGIVSPQHRGKFYGCRDEKRDLVGVALIGRNTLFEVRTDEAIIAFAKCARLFPDIRMVLAQEEELTTFWHDYDGAAPMPNVSRHQLITSSGCDNDDIELVDELRIATNDDLDQVVAAHADMTFVETGVNPLDADREGFRMRCSHRVDEAKVWVWIKDGELIFKTDVVSITPEAIYIEGLWVNPKERGKGNSTRGLTTMCQRLLTGSNAICAFLDEAHTLAHSLYRRSGFTGIDRYSRIYL